MPQLIDYIDKIARDKNRDVLYLLFKPQKGDDPFFFDYEACKRRKQVIKWLEKNNIIYYPCMGAAVERASLDSYRGFLYIDVPYDEANADFKKLSAYLEYPDGSMRYDDMIFAYYPLEKAMKNKHHDEPGFWDKFFDEQGW